MSSPKRLRVPLSIDSEGQTLTLPRDTANYVGRVHRLAPGDVFTAFDPQRALEADAEILRIHKHDGITVRLGRARPASITCPRSITLLQAMAKGDKMDAVLRDATELGLTGFRPILCERSVARPEDAHTRTARFERIAVQAARQSGRGDIPRIFPPTPLSDTLRGLSKQYNDQQIAPASFCLDPHASQPLRDQLLQLSHSTPIVLAIGPEGGFTEGETQMLARAGFARVRLGSLVLRTETVCAAVLGALLILTPSSEDPAEAPS